VVGVFEKLHAARFPTSSDRTISARVRSAGTRARVSVRSCHGICPSGLHVFASRELGAGTLPSGPG
jgi:hypothetical protein